MLLNPESITMTAEYAASGWDVVGALVLLVVATIIILDGRRAS